MRTQGKKRRGRAAQWARPSQEAMGKDTLGYWVQQYVEWLRTRNYSERTVELREGYLGNFVAWCEARNLYYPQEITRALIERYQTALYHYRKQDGRPLSFRAQVSRLISVRMYFKWLARQHVVALSPASELELPKITKHLPRTVLTVLEVEAILRLPDVNDVLGLRDRAMLEVLYATAIRRAELCNLRVFDVDVQRGTLLVREGKGKRDRVVPIGERALLWMEKYLGEARPELVLGIDEGALFLANTGEPMTLMRATVIVRDYVKRAELGKSGACHLFRHTVATLMLENGADIRFIQQLLGHANLETTSIYTQVSIHKLKQVYALTHPGAQLVPERSGGAACAETHPSLAAGASLAAEHDAGDAASALHAQLELEAEAEQQDEHP